MAEHLILGDGTDKIIGLDAKLALKADKTEVTTPFRNAVDLSSTKPTLPGVYPATQGGTYTGWLDKDGVSIVLDANKVNYIILGADGFFSVQDTAVDVSGKADKTEVNILSTEIDNLQEKQVETDIKISETPNNTRNEIISLIDNNGINSNQLIRFPFLNIGSGLVEIAKKQVHAGDVLNTSFYGDEGTIGLEIFDRTNTKIITVFGDGDSVLKTYTYTFLDQGSFRLISTTPNNKYSASITTNVDVKLFQKEDFKVIKKSLKGFLDNGDLELLGNYNLDATINGKVFTEGFVDYNNVVTNYDDALYHYRVWRNIPLKTDEGKAIEEIEITYKRTGDGLPTLLGIKRDLTVVNIIPINVSGIVTNRYNIEDYEYISVFQSVKKDEENPFFNVKLFYNSEKIVKKDNVKDYISKYVETSLLDVIDNNGINREVTVDLPFVVEIGTATIAKKQVNKGDFLNTSFFGDSGNVLIKIWNENDQLVESIVGNGDEIIKQYQYTFAEQGSFSITTLTKDGYYAKLTKLVNAEIVPTDLNSKIKSSLSGFLETNKFLLFEEKTLLETINGKSAIEGFLEANNTITPYDEELAYYKAWRNIPMVTPAGVKITSVELTYNRPSNSFPSFLGVKPDFSIENPLGLDAQSTTTKIIDVSGYSFISIYQAANKNSDFSFFNVKLITEDVSSGIKNVKNYIDNKTFILNAESTVKKPTKLLKLNFDTKDTLPNDKGTVLNGLFTYDDEGLQIKKFAKLEVQGSSSAVYPKKNWTFSLFSNEARSSKFKLRVGKWAFHSEFVFKSNYIDATHSRNNVCNKIWEDIVQSRNGFPKRENELTYNSSNATVSQRFDSGALCHVDGVPAELFINGVFYGLGSFNLGKKAENYDLITTNQNHIQLAAETHSDLYSYNALQWEIRSPKVPNGAFLGKINAWFDANSLTGSAFKNAFETNHDLRNAIDYFLMTEFYMGIDMFSKNFMLTSWDGIKFYFLPYDMDTVFGLYWDGLSILNHTSNTMTSVPFWEKFNTAYSVEIKARFAELKSKDILTENNVYRHFSEFGKVYGIEKYNQDFAKWSEIPSNNVGVTTAYGTGGCYTSVPQIMDWVKNRIIWMNTLYI